MRPVDGMPRGRGGPLEPAGRQLRDAQGSGRDEMLSARRALRRAEQAHDRAVVSAQRKLALAEGGTEREEAEERLDAARGERAGLQAATPLFDRLETMTEEGERVLDLAPAITTGHDGVLVITDRRMLFVGFRHALRLRWEQVRALQARGRWFGARLVVTTVRGEEIVFSGIAPRHALEVAELADRVRHP